MVSCLVSRMHSLLSSIAEVPEGILISLTSSSQISLAISGVVMWTHMIVSDIVSNFIRSSFVSSLQFINTRDVFVSSNAFMHLGLEVVQILGLFDSLSVLAVKYILFSRLFLVICSI